MKASCVQPPSAARCWSCARLVGYRLRPGVSATVFPAFTLEAGFEVEIPAGTRSQSIPEPGESMQTF